MLSQHPDVAEAAVIGRPDARWQEVPVAYVVRRAGTAATPADLEGFCLGQLARYKVPREFVFVDSLPHNALGKVQHFRLKELMARDAAASVEPSPTAQGKERSDSQSPPVEVVRSPEDANTAWGSSHAGALGPVQSHAYWLWQALPRKVAQNERKLGGRDMQKICRDCG